MQRLPRSSQNNETVNAYSYFFTASDRLSFWAKPLLGWLKIDKPQFYQIAVFHTSASATFELQLFCFSAVPIKTLSVTLTSRHKLFVRCTIASISTRTTIEARAYLSTGEGQTHRADLETENYLQGGGGEKKGKGKSPAGVPG